jgi:hypothetical protein
MTAIQFQALLKEDGTICVPAAVTSQLQGQGELQVVILLPESDDAEDEDWRRLGMEPFPMGYAESDSIYDDL